MQMSRVCYESASAASSKAQRRRVAAWAAEMPGLSPAEARKVALQFDQAIEMEPYFAEADMSGEFARARAALGGMKREELAKLHERLPVFPAAAREVVKMAADPELELDELERLARTDPVLAGYIIRTANSALHARSRPIADLSRALAQIGVDTARNVLLAAAVRVLFTATPFRTLWTHSLKAAQIADRLARLGSYIQPGEAFLTGLVHDIGRLLFLMAPGGLVRCATRLNVAGCPVAAVERALFGAEHGAVGAEILARWNFTSELQQAVRNHHCPERSGSIMAHLIYAAEFRLDSGEDLPSVARLRAACSAIRVPMETVTGLGFDYSGWNS
jgi:HD-like signal output (HDOD) protein